MKWLKHKILMWLIGDNNGFVVSEGDVIVYAKGYKDIQEIVRKLCLYWIDQVSVDINLQATRIDNIIRSRGSDTDIIDKLRRLDWMLRNNFPESAKQADKHYLIYGSWD